ncbi:MAG: hypothetical protein M5U26_08300 [Planctomycetota bacterium]|nr:hypothetical protein [Planctomycetota bacterium]
MPTTKQTQRPASRAQVQALIVQFARLALDGDPRACDPFGRVLADDRDGRLEWARRWLGIKRLESMNELTALQAQYLLDRLAGTETKLDAELRRQFERLGIRLPSAWFDEFRFSNRNRFKWGVVALSQLNRWQQWELLGVLKAR